MHLIIRKFPDKQWNRQNSILFHETIPEMCVCVYVCPVLALSYYITIIIFLDIVNVENFGRRTKND
jgi:hypothetical protein